MHDDVVVVFEPADQVHLDVVVGEPADKRHLDVVVEHADVIVVGEPANEVHLLPANPPGRVPNGSPRDRTIILNTHVQQCK